MGTILHYLDFKTKKEQKRKDRFHSTVGPLRQEPFALAGRIAPACSAAGCPPTEPRPMPFLCHCGSIDIRSKKPTMISNFFVLSPRGDTIIAKQYRNEKGNTGAHERSHTEAFFRKIKFWDDASYLTPGGGTKDTSKDKVTTSESEARKKRGDAPPIFMMPDGLTYMHVKRNGLIFGCATARNCSPVTVLEVRQKYISVFQGLFL